MRVCPEDLNQAGTGENCHPGCVEQPYPIPTFNHEQELAMGKKKKGKQVFKGILSKMNSLEQGENTVQATADCSVWLEARECSEKRLQREQECP